MLCFPVQNITYLWLSRLQLWWKRRPEDTDPPRTTSVTCPPPTSLPLRWQKLLSSLKPSSSPISYCDANNGIYFLSPLLDGNNEEWIWAAGGAAAHGSPEHEEVNWAHGSSLWWRLKQQKRRVKGGKKSSSTNGSLAVFFHMHATKNISEWGSTVFTVMAPFSDFISVGSLHDGLRVLDTWQSWIVALIN